jgi:hypothetical protein
VNISHRKESTIESIHDIISDIMTFPTYDATRVQHISVAMHQLSLPNSVVKLAALYLVFLDPMLKVVVRSEKLDVLLLICAVLRLSQLCAFPLHPDYPLCLLMKGKVLEDKCYDTLSIFEAFYNGLGAAHEISDVTACEADILSDPSFHPFIEERSWECWSELMGSAMDLFREKLMEGTMHPTLGKQQSGGLEKRASEGLVHPSVFTLRSAPVESLLQYQGYTA